MRHGVAFERTWAPAKRVRDGWNYDMRNETKPIAVKSLEGATRGPKPLFRSQLKNLGAACYFVRCNNL